MFTLDNIDETVYLMPEDGTVARAKWLEILAIPTECYINGYGFTMPEAFATIAAQADSGIPTHLLLDYSQSQGPTALALLQSLVTHMKVGNLTLTTAGINSRHTRQIWHMKGMVKLAADGGAPYCWRGSVNFSDSGWLQGNEASFFKSKIYADAFIAQHKAHEQWARQNEPQYQISAMSGDPITAYFASLAMSTVLDELNDRLDNQSLTLIGMNEDDAYQLGLDFGSAIEKMKQASSSCSTPEELKNVVELVMQSMVGGCRWLAALESLALMPPERPK